MPWDCDQHTWATYAQLDAELTDPRPLVLTAGDPPANYQAVFSRYDSGSETTVGLYAADADRFSAWLAEPAPRPLRPPERYPSVFRPLAEGPFSPHKNLLEDVQRLRRP